MVGVVLCVFPGSNSAVRDKRVIMPAMPVLATNYVNSTGLVVQTSIVTGFKVIHQSASVLLGEHIDQLLTITWTIGISYGFWKLQIISKWLSSFGFIASAINLLAQAELFATVIPGFSVWSQEVFLDAPFGCFGLYCSAFSL